MSRAQGVGLGLSIVKRLASLLECELTHGSVVGRGTVFSVLLPTGHSEDAAAVEPGAGTPKETGKQHGVVRVVIVEDDEAIADALGHWARIAGLDVVRFPSGEEALQQCIASAADFFLVDFRLAGKMTGFELLVAMAKASGPVRGAIITGESIQGVAELFECPWRVLSKPVSARDLQAVLHSTPKAPSAQQAGEGSKMVGKAKG